MNFFRLYVLLFVCIGIFSCSEKNDYKNISNLELKLRMANTEDSNDSLKIKANASELMTAYQQYVIQNPDSIMSSEFLCRAGGIAEGYLKNQKEALQIYESVIEKYPESQAEMLALNRLGYIHRYHLQEPEKASKYYQTFIQKYPFTAQSMQVRLILDSIQKETSNK